MTERKSQVFICILAAVFVLVPVFVIKKTVDLQSGWNGLAWESTQDEVKEWVKKNNTKYSYSPCSQSHFDVSCFKLSWKNTEHSPFEYIEFQFKDGLLCAVIETGKPVFSDPAVSLGLGSPESGRDLRYFFQKEKGIKYKYTERVFYYTPSEKRKSSGKYQAVCRLVRNIPSDPSFADENVLFRLTTVSCKNSSFDISENVFFPPFVP